MLAENEAALEALKAAYKPAQIHEPNKVPDLATTPYGVVSVSSGPVGNYRLSGQHGSRGYRISVQCFGKSDSEISRIVDAAEACFLDNSLPIPGYDTTPCLAEVSTPITRDPDGGSFLNCFLSFTFHSFPEESS